MNEGIAVLIYVSGNIDSLPFQHEKMRDYISKLKSVGVYRHFTELEELRLALSEESSRTNPATILAHYCSSEEAGIVKDLTKHSTNTTVIDLFGEVFFPHSNEMELANAKAIDVVRLAISAAKKRGSSSIESTSDVERKIAVIGGGISGISAAIELAKNDVEVYLIEKEDSLGGHMKGLHKIYPLMCPAQCSLEFYLPMVLNNNHVKIFLNSEVRKINGHGGKYGIEILTHSPDNEKITSVTVGSMIVATGWKPFDPAAIPNYQYGKSKNIVTNWEFENNGLRDDLLKKKVDRKDFSVLFIQCVGSRDSRYLPYCSGVCCNVSFKQIEYVKEKIPDARIFVSYIDLRTPQTYEMFYQSILEKYQDVVLIRGKPGEIVQDPKNGTIGVHIDDTLRNREWDLNPDLVVLATGMVPNNDEIASVMNVPITGNGFPENHLQCNPYLSQKNGVYFAGTAMSPSDISTSVMSSLGASMKAFTYINRLPNEVHAQIENAKCDICKRCIEECPQKVLYLGVKGYPEVATSGCEACGICMGACPDQAISLPTIGPAIMNGWISILSKSAQAKNEPLILALFCKNDAYPLLQKMVSRGFKYPANYRIIPVPCAGSVNTRWISEAIIKGINGVLVVGCRENQCHFVNGAKYAAGRVENLQNSLENELKLGGHRVRFANINMNDESVLERTMESFYHKIKERR